MKSGGAILAIAFIVLLACVHAWSSERQQQKRRREHPQKDDARPYAHAATQTATHTRRNRLPPLLLTYTNTSDVTQTRLIEPYRSGATVDTFDAWCHQDNRRRSFWFLRTVTATDATTGELLTQAGLYRLIHPKRRIPEWVSDELPAPEGPAGTTQENNYPMAIDKE